MGESCKKEEEVRMMSMPLHHIGKDCCSEMDRHRRLRSTDPFIPKGGRMPRGVYKMTIVSSALSSELKVTRKYCSERVSGIQRAWRVNKLFRIHTDYTVPNSHRLVLTNVRYIEMADSSMGGTRGLHPLLGGAPDSSLRAIGI